MAADDLLRDATALPNAARVRLLVLLGRAARGGDAAAKDTVAALAAHPEVFARSLALQAARGARDGAHVLAAMDDRSAAVRRRADGLVAEICTDDEARAALVRAATPRRQQRLARSLALAGRRGVVDAYTVQLSVVSARTVRSVALFGTTNLVQRTADGELLGHAGWQRLALHHPGDAAARLLAELNATPDAVDTRTRSRLTWVVKWLARGAPDATLAIVRRLHELQEDPGQSYIRSFASALLLVRPRETFDLLRAWHMALHGAAKRPLFAGLALGNVAPRLGAERLAWAVCHATEGLIDGTHARRWFYRLDEPTRNAVVDAWLAGGTGTWGAFLLRYAARSEPARAQAFARWRAAATASAPTLAMSALLTLPSDLREQEGRRHLARTDSFLAAPLARLAYAALLPFEEAKSALASELGHPDGAMRAAAIRAVIGSVAHDGAALPAALELVVARAFEQDPVRLAMFAALATLPQRHFAMEHFGAIERIFAAALAASDLSSDTALHSERLALRLAPIDRERSAELVAGLVKARESLRSPDVGKLLSPAEVGALDAALHPKIDAWLARENTQGILAVGRSLGKRLLHAPSVLDALERIARVVRHASPVLSALVLLRTVVGSRFRRLATELLAVDRSVAILEPVASLLSAQRQDLLLSVLDGAPLAGRFATGQVRVVVDYGDRFGRWTAEAERRYGHELVALTVPDKSGTSTPRAQFAIHRLSRLPDLSPTVLRDLADSPLPAVRELAVRALGHVDDDAATGQLAAYLGDDRARWAAYGLGARLTDMSPANVVTALRDVPRTKLTVAKEVVRLLGDFGGDDGLAELERLTSGPLHRDLRVAALRALWTHLETTLAWDILTRATGDADGIVASSVAQVPLDALSLEAEARATDLHARLLLRPEPQTRQSVLTQAAQAPLRDRSRAFLHALLAHVARLGAAEAGDVVNETAQTIDIVLTRLRPEDAPRLVAAVTSVAARAAERRTLAVFLDGITARARTSPAIGQVGAELLHRLGGDAVLLTRRLHLASVLLPTAAFAEYLLTIAATEDLHADALSAAVVCLGRHDEIAPLEARLAASPDPRLRRIALAALLHDARPGRGWTEERRARLEIYRRDPSTLVAAHAQFVFPPLT